MGMQTDVLASKPRTDAGQLLDQNSLVIGRCRVKAIYIVPNSAAGQVIFKDGGSGGPTKAIKRCCLPDLLGMIHQPVNLLLQPVKPVKKHLCISANFSTGYVISSNFLAGLVE